MLVGILSVNKPPGISSRQAVDLVKRLVRPAKVGHAGTLDPLATGVLVVCIGKATRLIEFVQQMPKQYRATFLLGRTSPTEDVEGEVTEIVDSPTPGREEIESVCDRFIGTIEQRPPVFSALKVGGRRAYDLARGGKAVELAPRPVTIYGMAILEYEYPRLTLDVRCGSGTYVRSLGRDLAESLGTGAVMSELTRTEIGPFHIDSAIDPCRLNESVLRNVLQPPQDALVGLPQIVLDEREIELVAHGRFMDCTDSESGITESLLVAIDEHSEIVAVLKRRDDGALWPYINFVGKG
ncbi:MAG: tRNA pseudouridine(55) synthase TruB [Pirellulales bacterium]